MAQWQQLHAASYSRGQALASAYTLTRKAECQAVSLATPIVACVQINTHAMTTTRFIPPRPQPDRCAAAKTTTTTTAKSPKLCHVFQCRSNQHRRLTAASTYASCYNESHNDSQQVNLEGGTQIGPDLLQCGGCCGATT
jgi:hypothetical protein